MSEPVGDTAVPVARPAWCAWLLGRGGWWAAFAWGLAEGTLFFFMPDLLLTVVALFDFRAALRRTFAVVAGALFAGVIMFSWAVHDPAGAEAAVLRVPAVRPAMVETVRGDYIAHGAAALLFGPTSGVPYKLYAVEAPGRVSLPVFLAVSVPARLERLAITLVLFGALGWIFRRWIGTHPHGAVAFHAVYWVAVYSWYWSVI